MEKKEAARILFMEGHSITDICKLLTISDTTMTRWCSDGDWKTKRTMRGLFEQTSVEALKEIADYQLKALVHFKNKLLEAGEWELIDKGHFDAISKAFANIKGPEQKWEHAVRLMRRFLEFLENKNNVIAKQVQPHIDAYLNELRKTMNQ